MKGWEHYQEAERLLVFAAGLVSEARKRVTALNPGGDAAAIDMARSISTAAERVASQSVAAAAVHAQLATAAATALQKVGAADKWLDVAG
jgi:hypothetical protein